MKRWKSRLMVGMVVLGIDATVAQLNEAGLAVIFDIQPDEDWKEVC